MMRYLLIFGSLFCTLLLSAQRDRRSVPYSVRGVIGIPKALSSAQFRTAFNGVYEANISVNARTFSTFFVGLGYQNTHFQNNKKVFAFYTAPPGSKNSGNFLSYNTRLICHGAFLKLGYDKFFEKGFVSYSLNAGMMFCGYKNVIEDTNAVNFPFPPPTFNAPFIQPELAVNFLTDGPLSFSLLLSYGTMLTKFDPKQPRFNGFEEVRKEKNNYLISWINIGFGFGILLGK